MFNPEQMLGQLLGSAMNGGLGGKKRNKRPGHSSWAGGLSTGTKVQVGLGLLGVAMAAYEHYSAKPAAASNTAVPTPGRPFPPPPPSPPPPPLPPAGRQPEHALHLLRAMITAADADGLIDAEEREHILGRARELGADADALQSLHAEISAPLTLQQLVVRTPAQLRDEVYAAALIAITADTEEERRFLDQLASGLQLDAGQRQRIHQQLGFT